MALKSMSTGGGGPCWHLDIKYTAPGHETASVYINDNVFDGQVINLDIAESMNSTSGRVNLYMSAEDALDLATVLMYKARQAIESKEKN